MRKTLLCGGAALFALAAAPCFAQDAASAAGAEIGKAANQAARQAADHAAASVGMSSKSTDKTSSKSSTDSKSVQAAQNSGGKPVYSGAAAEDNGGAAPSDQPANAQPNKDPSDGKAQ